MIVLSYKREIRQIFAALTAVIFIWILAVDQIGGQIPKPIALLPLLTLPLLLEAAARCMRLYYTWRYPNARRYLGQNRPKRSRRKARKVRKVRKPEAS